MCLIKDAFVGKKKFDPEFQSTSTQTDSPRSFFSVIQVAVFRSTFFTHLSCLHSWYASHWHSWTIQKRKSWSFNHAITPFTTFLNKSNFFITRWPDSRHCAHKLYIRDDTCHTVYLLHLWAFMVSSRVNFTFTFAFRIRVAWSFYGIYLCLELIGNCVASLP